MLAVGFIRFIHTSILSFGEHYFKYSLMIPPPPVFSLQFRVRRRLTAEGGGEKTVQAFSVSHPLSTLVPGAEAAQAHETRERSCSPCRTLADRQTLLLIAFPCLCRSSGCWMSSHLLRRWRTSASCKFSACAAQLCISYSRCKYPSKGGVVGVGGGHPGGKHACSNVWLLPWQRQYVLL